MTTQNQDKATARPWRIVERDTPCQFAIGLEHAEKSSATVVADFFTPSECGRDGFNSINIIKANAALIVRAVNEHDALCKVAEAADLAETYLEDGAPASALRVIKDALANLAAIRKL